MPPKSEKDDAISQLANRILSAMLDELILDTTLKSHHEVARSKTVCPVCNTRCGAIHTPGSSSSAANESSQFSAKAPSRAATPSSAASNEFTLAKQNANGISTPTGGKDGNLYLECVVCSRQISSNRYAPHLASCMGLGSARRNGARGTAKPKLPSDAGRSASPVSEGGDGSEERPNGKGKSKVKDDGEFAVSGNGKRKRVGSPHISPNKKSKQGKAAASPVSRVKAEPDLAGLPSNSHFSPSASSQSKVPSKLRDSSTASFLEHSSDGSRDSSPETMRTPGSSFSAQSPARSRTNGKALRGRLPVKGTGPPKRPTPPRPQPIHVYHDEIDHANETGSSTDTDSD
ncbi:hypothetical protein CPB83DRAFT_841950 [Crepidotus variabilis]|uniref:SAGA-associated factor 11 n=1 Tax=Crepidotus variabilis TaxID=179855 RepID=A0A9P6EU66_9AGAR|nr:hypothetical protein CPB83DRAFT_841950 [Crepidotus variabilis]